MITFRGDKLRVPERLYIDRVARLRKMMELDAPRCIIQLNAELVVRCFQISWATARYSLWLHYCPNWIKWLTSAQWRRDVATWEAEDEGEAE